MRGLKLSVYADWMLKWMPRSLWDLICSITKALKDFFLEIGIGTSVEFQIIVITRGGAMLKSGGSWTPKILKILNIYIYIYIYNFFNFFKI